MFEASESNVWITYLWWENNLNSAELNFSVFKVPVIKRGQQVATINKQLVFDSFKSVLENESKFKIVKIVSFDAIKKWW